MGALRHLAPDPDAYVASALRHARVRRGDGASARLFTVSRHPIRRARFRTPQNEYDECGMEPGWAGRTTVSMSATAPSAVRSLSPRVWQPAAPSLLLAQPRDRGDDHAYVARLDLRRDADAYQRFLIDGWFSSMRRIDGFRGADLLRRPDGDEIAFVTLIRFASRDAIRAFGAGTSQSRCRAHAG